MYADMNAHCQLLLLCLLVRTQEDEPAVPHAATRTSSNTTNAATGGKEDAAQAARRAEIEEKVALAKAAQEAKVCTAITALVYSLC
jgi:hypothetical protein